MKSIDFSGCSSRVSPEDLKRLEREIGTILPDDFKAFYTIHNGGTPFYDWFPCHGEWEPIWIGVFMPIDTSPCMSDDSIASTYYRMTRKGLLEATCLPFALDPGGNFFCIDLKDGSVFYFMNDVYDPGLSKTKNQDKARRMLTKSFAEFIDLLVSEEDAYGC